MKLKEGQKERILGIYLPLLLFALNLVFKLFFIEKRDVSIDEPFTIFHAQQSVRDIIALSSSGEPNPPTHLLFLHFWILLFGNSALSVRLLSLLFNSIAVVVIYLTGKKFFNYRAGLAASLLFIFSFYNFFHSLEARTYAMFVMTTALALYFYLSLTREINIRNLMALLLSNVLVIYAHYFGWFVIFAEFIGLVLYWPHKKFRKGLILVIVLTGLSFLPILRSVINQFSISSGGTWLDPPQANQYIREMIFLFNAKPVTITLIIILIVGIAVSGFRKAGRSAMRKDLILLFLWWFLPYTLMFVLSFKLPMFNSRYILYTSVGLYLFTAVLVSHLFEKKYFMIASLAIMVIVMALNLKILPDDFGRREIEDTVQFVKAEEKKLNERVILLYPGWSDMPFMYYYDRQIFNQPYRYNELCNSEGVIKIWNSGNLKEQVDYLSNKDIIMVIDRSEEDASVFFDILSSSHKKISGGTFPETYSVGVFTAQSSD